MSRITETENVTLTTVAVAPRIIIQWNPHDDSGYVEFHTEKMESVDGVFQRMVPGQWLSYPLEDILARAVTIPLPDGSTFDFPPQLIGAYIKQLFDDLYTEHVIAQETETVDAPLEN